MGSIITSPFGPWPIGLFRNANCLFSSLHFNLCLFSIHHAIYICYVRIRLRGLIVKENFVFGSICIRNNGSLVCNYFHKFHMAFKVHNTIWSLRADISTILYDVMLIVCRMDFTIFKWRRWVSFFTVFAH